MRLKVPNIVLLEGAGIIMEMMEIGFVDRPGEKLGRSCRISIKCVNDAQSAQVETADI